MSDFFVTQNQISGWINLLDTFNNPHIESDPNKLTDYLSFIAGLAPAEKGIDLGICVFIAAHAHNVQSDLGSFHDLRTISTEADSRILCHILFLKNMINGDIKIPLQEITDFVTTEATNLIKDCGYEQIGAEEFKQIGMQMVEFIGREIID